MIASITGNPENLELSDADLEAISGGGLFSWAKKKVTNAAYSIYNAGRNGYNTIKIYY